MNTKIHRVVPDFVIQMGDITIGDGTGGRWNSSVSCFSLSIHKFMYYYMTTRDPIAYFQSNVYT